MPNKNTLQKKQALVEELTGKLNNAVSGVVVSYKGITVAEDTQLRSNLRKAGVDYTVIKNTMLRRAVDAAGMSELDSILKGTTALAVSTGDYVAGAKILSEFAEKNDSFEIKGGFVDGKPIDAAGVKELASLPPKEVLVAKALGGLNAPISGFVCVLNANLRSLVVALNAIAQKQGA